MGQAESHPSDSPGLSGLGGPGAAQTTAFHVLRVAENSPAAEAGLEPFFDFIVGAGGSGLGDEIDALTDVLEHNEDREVSLQVYSTKRKEVREVYVTPSRSWSSDPGAAGPGVVDGQPSLLGLSLRLCNPRHALEQVWHVLEILEGSPAQSAGLVPFGDWIVGYAGGVLRGEGDFYDVVEAHVDKPLRLFVYNSDYDVTREAILVPNRSWGGEGLLGCGVGYGLLHRIPKPQDRPRVISRRDEQPSSFSARPPPAQNPLYAPPPPPAQRNAPASPPPRRTAAVEQPTPSYDSHSSYASHPSFSYDDRSSYGVYDASEGVSVVPVEEEFVSADSFHGAAPMSVPTGAQTGYRAPSPFRPTYGSTGGGAAQVIAEEAEE
ncbi:hypothetical protein JCM21900_002483 [Sporobolomyces salmonicolor]